MIRPVRPCRTLCDNVEMYPSEIGCIGVNCLQIIQYSRVYRNSSPFLQLDYGINYRLQGPATDFVLRQVIPVQNCKPYFFKIYFNPLISALISKAAFLLNFCTHLSCPLLATYPTHPFVLDLIILIMSDDEYILYS